MLFWVGILVFGVPLYVFIRNSRSSIKAREKRLEEIQARLKEKQLEKIESKKQRINEKNKV